MTDPVEQTSEETPSATRADDVSAVEAAFTTGTLSTGTLSTGQGILGGEPSSLAAALIELERFDAAALQAWLRGVPTARPDGREALAVARLRALAALVDRRPGHGLAELDAPGGAAGADTRSPAGRAALAGPRALLQLALGNPHGARAILRRDAHPGPQTIVDSARIDLFLGRSGAALQQIASLAGEFLAPRASAEAAAVEAAVLLRFSTTARSRGVVLQLGAQLEHARLLLPVALLPPADVGQVVGALSAAGFGALLEEATPPPLLSDVEAGTVLSKREAAVLQQLLVTGSISEIARSLVVSTNTVKTQLRSIYRKLGVSNREDAIAVALARHLLVDRDDV